MREFLLDSAADPIAERTPEPAESAPTKRPHPTDPRRWADGTQRPAAPGIATKSGVYARQHTPELLAIVGDLDAFRAGLETDQGGRGELSTICAGYIQRLAEVEGLCRLLGADLMRRGIFTKGGRTRSTFAAYLAAVARWDQLAKQLGLDRRSKDASLLDLSASEYAQATQEGGRKHEADPLGETRPGSVSTAQTLQEREDAPPGR